MKRYTLRVANIDRDWWDWGIYDGGRLVIAASQAGESYPTRAAALEAGRRVLAEFRVPA